MFAQNSEKNLPKFSKNLRVVTIFFYSLLGTLFTLLTLYIPNNDIKNQYYLLH